MDLSGIALVDIVSLFKRFLDKKKRGFLHCQLMLTCFVKFAILQGDCCYLPWNSGAIRCQFMMRFGFLHFL